MMRCIRPWLGTLLTTAFLCLAAAPMWSATLTVNTLADDQTGLPCPSNDFTLRCAILAANPGDTINFRSSLSGTIVLVQGPLPTVTQKPLTINGGGRITVSGNDLFQVLNVAGNANLTLSSITISHGRATNGAGILNFGTLTVSASTISNNHATRNQGGGIDNFGTLTVKNSSIINNLASTNSLFLVNTGGGIENEVSAVATISNSTISGNVAGQGGGIENLGTLTISNTNFSNNTLNASSIGRLGEGGAINNLGGRLTISNATFSNNTSDGNGGGIENFGGTATITNVKFFHNSALINGGGFANVDNGQATITNTLFDGNTAGQSGGGIFSESGSVTVKNSAIINSSPDDCEITGGTFVFRNSRADDDTCDPPPSITKQFVPDEICLFDRSQVVITLESGSAIADTSIISFEDRLPSGLRIVRDSAHTDCGGTLAIDGRTVRLSGGTIPTDSSCQITLSVKACSTGHHTNRIKAGALQTDMGSNLSPAVATLIVLDASSSDETALSCEADQQLLPVDESEQSDDDNDENSGMSFMQE